MNSSRRVLRCESHKSAAFLGGFFLFGVFSVFVSSQSSVFNVFWLITLLLGIFALVVESIDRRYRLRLLPNGVRETQCGTTTNLLAPTIADPNSIVSSSTLRLQNGDRVFDLCLHEFSRRDQALILEHCSQFLTPAQQADCGERWAREHARLIKPPKPDEWLKNFLSLWRTVCIAAAVCIVGWPVLMELSVDSSLDINSPWEVPEIRTLFPLVLAGLVAAPPVFLILGAACLGLDWISRQLAGYLSGLCVHIRWLMHSVTRNWRRVLAKPETGSAL